MKLLRALALFWLKDAVRTLYRMSNIQVSDQATPQQQTETVEGKRSWFDPDAHTLMFAHLDSHTLVYTSLSLASTLPASPSTPVPSGYSAITIAQSLLQPGSKLLSFERELQWVLVSKRFLWQASQGEGGIQAPSFAENGGKLLRVGKSSQVHMCTKGSNFVRLCLGQSSRGACLPLNALASFQAMQECP